MYSFFGNPWLAGFLSFCLFTVAGCGPTASPQPVEPAHQEPTLEPDPNDTSVGDTTGEEDAAVSDYWEPFAFKAGEYFKYDLKQISRDDELTGWFSVEFSDAGDDQLKTSWEGVMGQDAFSSSVISHTEDAMAQMMFGLMMTPSAAPVVTTLLAPWWGIFFVGHKWEMGSHWSFKSDYGSSSFEIVEQSTYAGVQGYLGRWVEDGELRAEICISPHLPLALFVNLKSDSKVYISELTEYRGP